VSPNIVLDIGEGATAANTRRLNIVRGHSDGTSSAKLRVEVFHETT
jgi:hypothetical protein